MPLLLLLVACGPSTPGTGDDTGVANADDPTWYADVAPVVTRSCAGCHLSGGVAPFALDSYEAAAAQALAMASSVESGAMPPFDAIEDDDCAPTHGWQDDPRLTPDEKAMLRAWADAGAPAGDPESAAPLFDPPQLGLDGATDRLIPRTSFVSSGRSDQFYCVSLDIGLTDDSWLTGIQVVPDNTEVVHHVLVFTDPHAQTADWGDEWRECFNVPTVPDLSLIAAWAPGALPFEAPPTSAIDVKAGTRLLLQVHYHPNGAEAAADATGVELRFEDITPEWNASLILAGNAGSAREGLLDGPNDRDGAEFRIPAGAVGHTETIQYDLGRGTGNFRVFGAGTHMHYIGTEMEIRWKRPEGAAHGPEDECLVKTDWDFNWQRTYYYDADIEDLPRAKGGDSLWLQCRYDNTLDNPGVQRALADAGLEEPIDVALGETTLDEMCLGVFGLLTPL